MSTHEEIDSDDHSVESNEKSYLEEKSLEAKKTTWESTSEPCARSAYNRSVCLFEIVLLCILIACCSGVLGVYDHHSVSVRKVENERTMKYILHEFIAAAECMTQSNQLEISSPT